ncbi:hypothetical protein COY32_03395, partial [candidate division WWE3 bacterium CG_4_10_14_0_2_um_filter_41_14]
HLDTASPSTRLLSTSATQDIRQLLSMACHELVEWLRVVHEVRTIIQGQKELIHIPDLRLLNFE